jgi:hypothetical protein
MFVRLDLVFISSCYSKISNRSGRRVRRYEVKPHEAGDFQPIIRHMKLCKPHSPCVILYQRGTTCTILFGDGLAHVVGLAGLWEGWFSEKATESGSLSHSTGEKVFRKKS